MADNSKRRIGNVLITLILAILTTGVLAFTALYVYLNYFVEVAIVAPEEIEQSRDKMKHMSF